jgi:hypothetical protein
MLQSLLQNSLSCNPYFSLDSIGDLLVPNATHHASPLSLLPPDTEARNFFDGNIKYVIYITDFLFHIFL